MSDETFQHSASARAVLRSLVPVIVHPKPTPSPTASSTISRSRLARCRRWSAARWRRARSDLGALPRYRKRARHLSPAPAERYYQSWEHGLTPLHVQFARGLNQMMSLSCYEQPAMRERVSYQPEPWIADVTRKRLQQFPTEIRRQEASTLAPDPLRPGVHVGARRKLGR
ncbi:MAG: hypothetical protein WKG01_40625 [Kofleriaceae bacterium]